MQPIQIRGGRNAAVSGIIWKSIVTSQDFPVSSFLKDVPPWCKCGKCREESDLLDRICCKNHPKNHENQKI